MSGYAFGQPDLPGEMALRGVRARFCLVQSSAFPTHLSRRHSVVFEARTVVHPGQSFLSSGSSSSEMSRMLDSAVGSGMPAQWVRKMRWLTPSSSK